MVAGVQVSLEDAEVLMATAHRISIAGQVTCAPYKVITQLVSCVLGQGILIMYGPSSQEGICGARTHQTPFSAAAATRGSV